jgi:hypothetical protein
MGTILSDHDHPPEAGSVLAYADDISSFCPADCLRALFLATRSILSDYDLQLVLSKCQATGSRIEHLPTALQLTDLDIKVMPDGLERVVGSPVGSADFCAASVKRTLLDLAASLSTLHTIHR